MQERCDVRDRWTHKWRILLLNPSSVLNSGYAVEEFRTGKLKRLESVSVCDHSNFLLIVEYLLIV
jgi:hypothetical protein